METELDIMNKISQKYPSKKQIIDDITLDSTNIDSLHSYLKLL